MKTIALLWFRWQAHKAARLILAMEFSHAEAELILKGYWQRYLALKPDIPTTVSAGGNIMVNLAAMSTAFYNELTNRGENQESATRIFYNIAWAVYQKMGYFTWQITRIKTGNNAKRLAMATKLFRKFPFSEPAYKWQEQKDAGTSIKFHCVECPVAAYFETQELQEFCVDTWCALDFPLANIWHGRLERTGSIAGGASQCDFEFISQSI